MLVYIQQHHLIQVAELKFLADLTLEKVWQL